MYVDPNRKIEYLALRGEIFTHKQKSCKVQVLTDTSKHGGATFVRFLTTRPQGWHKMHKYGHATMIRTKGWKIGDTGMIVLTTREWTKQTV